MRRVGILIAAGALAAAALGQHDGSPAATGPTLKQLAGQRIEAAGVPRLLGLIDALDPLQRRVRRQARRLVEQQDAVNFATGLPASGISQPYAS